MLLRVHNFSIAERQFNLTKSLYDRDVFHQNTVKDLKGLCKQNTVNSRYSGPKRIVVSVIAGYEEKSIF